MSRPTDINSSCARDKTLSLTCSCATGKKQRSCGTGYASWRQRNMNFSTSTRSRSMRYDMTRKFSHCHQKCLWTTSPTWISSKQILGWGPNYKQKVSERFMRTFLITQSLHKISVNQLLTYRSWSAANNPCALGKYLKWFKWGVGGLLSIWLTTVMPHKGGHYRNREEKKKT